MSDTPYADQMRVDPSLDNLAAYLVAGMNAWTSHNADTLNNNLQLFWSEEGNLDPALLATGSAGTLTGGLVQDDVTALDAYSHRMLGMEYLYQITFANPPDIPALLALEVAQFQISIPEFQSAGLAMQAADDQKILDQAGVWASQTSAAWIDDTYTTAVKDQAGHLVTAAGNIISSAGSLLGYLQNPLILGGVAVLGLLLVLKVAKP